MTDNEEIAEEMISSAMGAYGREARKLIAREYGIDWTSSRLDHIDLRTGIGIGKQYERRHLKEEKDKVRRVYDFFQLAYSVRKKIVKEEDIEAAIKGKVTKSIKKYARDYVSDMMCESEFIMDIADEYGEPGYTRVGSEGILFGDWNEITNEMYDAIEESGYDMEWSDEWFVDYDTQKAYRTSPDSYGWEPAYFFDGYEFVPIEDNPCAYIEYVMNDHTKALNSEFDAEPYGFEDAEDLCHETGWYGRVDDPKEALDLLRKEIEFDDFVFQICSVGQFAVNWKILVRVVDEED